MSGLPTDLTLTVAMGALLGILGLALYLKGTLDAIMLKLDVSDDDEPIELVAVCEEGKDILIGPVPSGVRVAWVKKFSRPGEEGVETKMFLEGDIVRVNVQAPGDRL